MSWLVPALPEFEKSHPHRRIHLYFGDTADVLPRVLRQQVDAFVTSARITDGGLVMAKLAEEEYVFVASRRLLKRVPLAEPSDAGAHTLLDIHADLPLFRYFLDARPAREVWGFGAVQHLGAIAALRERVRAGAGVSVLPRYYVRDDLKRGRLIALFPETKLPSDWFRLVWRNGHPRGEALRELAGELARRPLR
jgi:DNA-binding transcriptional LysR family regulator